MPTLSIRVDLDPEGQIGPGKIELLENVAAFGSISAAARHMGMSYKHAWDLIEEMNLTFCRPVVEGQTGGRRGGGSGLTAVGLALVGRYRAIERAAKAVSADQLEALQAEVRTEFNAQPRVRSSATSSKAR